MRIITIESWIVRVPLLTEWATSPEFGEHLQAEKRLILRIGDGEGQIGWGEMALIREGVILEELAPLLLNVPLAHLRLSSLDLWPSGSQYWQRPVPPSPFSPNLANLRHRLRHPLQVVFEMALSDLIARRADVPAYQLFGGKWRDRVKSNYWMGRVTPQHAQRCIQRAQQLGFNGVKLKTTIEDPNVERLEAIHEIAPTWKVTVDSNGRFYRLDDALPIIRAMDELGNMAILEDPFPRFHLQEFASLRSKIQARVVVHIDPAESLWAVLQAGAAGGLNIDSRTQGLFQWRLQAGVAKSFQIRGNIVLTSLRR